jgi:membrane protease YdiL (CAAX protease family)
MAGARVETQLQLTAATLTGHRGTAFLMLGMLGWIVAGFGGALAATALVGAGSAIVHMLPGGAAIPSPDKVVYVLVASCGFQTILLLAALWQASRYGGGDRRAGLGIRPIRHGGVILLLCATMIALLLGFVSLVALFPGLRQFAESVTPRVLSEDTSPGVLVLKLFLIAVLAPVSEELFFRGWIWEALRHRGQSVAMTVCLSVLPWLLLHGIDSPGRILFIIPAGLIFSLARQVGDSVLASLSIHVTNNGMAVLMQLLSMYFGDTA